MNTKPELVLLSTKNYKTDKWSMIKLIVISSVFVATGQHTLYNIETYKNPGIVAAITYVAITLFSIGIIFSIYRIIKPQIFLTVTKKGINFYDKNISWDEIESIELIKLVDSWFIKPKTLGIVLDINHPKYKDMNTLQKIAFEATMASYGVHIMINQSMGLKNVETIATELNCYLKQYKDSVAFQSSGFSFFDK